MPIGIKDLIETVDMPTEYGSEPFRDHRLVRDAASVNALRRGGAVILGKTVTVTFGGGRSVPHPQSARSNPHAVGGSSVWYGGGGRRRYYYRVRLARMRGDPRYARPVFAAHTR